MNESEVKLKHCPFCGSSNLKLYTKEDDGGYNGFVRCMSCDALLGEFVHYILKKECEAGIVKLWNKRTGDIDEIASAAINVYKDMLNLLEKLNDFYTTRDSRGIK